MLEQKRIYVDILCPHLSIYLHKRTEKQQLPTNQHKTTTICKQKHAVKIGAHKRET